MRTTLFSTALAAIGMVTSVAGQAPATGAAPPPPLIRENATVKLTEHVWAIPDFNVGLVPNIGIIVGSKATLVVDTGLGPRNGEAIVREMKKVSRNADVFVVTTHYHPEHSLGAGAFTGAKLVMTRVQQQEMTEVGKAIQDTFASRSAINKELLSGVPYPTPDILFDREHRIDLGGVHVRLFWRGPGTMHTRGDTMVWVEEDRVLFTGDVVMSQRFLAAQNNSSLKTWLSVLDELTALKPLHVVPSHGKLGDATLIDRDREFIQAVQARVGELKTKGASIDDAVAVVAEEIAPRFPEFGNPAGAAAVTRAAYAEASLQEVVTIVTDRPMPPMTSTPQEELERLRDSDAIAVIEIESVRGELASARREALTKVRGTVRVSVKTSDRAALSQPDGTIEFEFTGGEVDGASYGEYPILKIGQRYLLFFQLHPLGTRWYPFLPFRVDEAGRLDQVAFVSPDPLGWKSPINRMPLSEVVKGLRKQ